MNLMSDKYLFIYQQVWWSAVVFNIVHLKFISITLLLASDDNEPLEYFYISSVLLYIYIFLLWFHRITAKLIVLTGGIQIE